jgi:hypothetical protein
VVDLGFLELVDCSPNGTGRVTDIENVDSFVVGRRNGGLSTRSIWWGPP